jgi:Flp pilus assembly protein TadG
MISRTPVSSRRRRRSPGNTLIESAFTLVPTFALILGFMDFGLMLFRWSTLQNSVREGVRYGITFSREGSYGQTESIKRQVARYALGIVPTTGVTVCYATTTAPTTCIASGGNVPGNIVEVSVQNRGLDWLFPLSGVYGTGALFANSPLHINVYSADLLGGYPLGSEGGVTE